MDRRAAILAAISGAVVGVVAAHVLAHRPTAGQEVAQVIERRTDPRPDAEAAEDERLTGDANEAGYRWAERRGLTDPADCPSYFGAFWAGCAEYVRDQGR